MGFGTALEAILQVIPVDDLPHGGQEKISNYWCLEDMKFLLNIVTSWLDKNSPKPIVDTVLDNISASKYTGYKILKEPHVVFN